MQQFNALSYCDMVTQKIASHLCFIIFILLLWKVPRWKYIPCIIDQQFYYTYRCVVWPNWYL